MMDCLSQTGVWRPRQEPGTSFYTPALNPRTGLALAVPALVLPKGPTTYELEIPTP